MWRRLDRGSRLLERLEAGESACHTYLRHARAYGFNLINVTFIKRTVDSCSLIVLIIVLYVTSLHFRETTKKNLLNIAKFL